MLRPLLNTSALVQPALEMDVDYQESEPTAVPIVVDVGATTPEIRYDWTSVTGIGYVGAARMQVALRDDPSVSDVAVDAGLTDVVAAGSTTPTIRYDWTSVTGIGYVGAARMQVALRDDPSVSDVATDTSLTNVVAVDHSDLLATSPGLPYDVPCQLIGFDVMFQIGGQL
jgi:hypothetical protein